MAEINKKSETPEESAEKKRLLFEQPVKLKKIPEGVEIRKAPASSKSWLVFTFIAILALGGGLIVMGNSYLSAQVCEQYRDPHDPIGCALAVIGSGFKIGEGSDRGIGIASRRCTTAIFRTYAGCTDGEGGDGTCKLTEVWDKDKTFRCKKVAGNGSCLVPC